MSIEIVALSKHFGKQSVFSGFSAFIPENSCTVVTGPSGCGKTTLIRIISGLDKKYSGTVSGVPHKISYLFQENRLLPWMTLRQNVEFVLRDIMDPKEASDKALEMIDAVKLSGHEDKYPADLSGGMQRRTAIARTFSYPAELIILDEPFDGLDAKLKADIIDLFDELFIKTRKTVIIVTHDSSIKKRFGQNLIDISCDQGLG